MHPKQPFHRLGKLGFKWKGPGYSMSVSFHPPINLLAYKTSKSISLHSQCHKSLLNHSSQESNPWISYSKSTSSEMFDLKYPRRHLGLRVNPEATADLHYHIEEFIFEFASWRKHRNRFYSEMTS